MLTPNEHIILTNFAEKIKADIQHAIKNKRVTKFGAVDSSGRLHDSVEIKYTENGFQIWVNSYIENLVDGIAPGESKARILDIKRWIDEKPINASIPKDTLAYLILRKQKREGNMIWRTYKGQNSGLLTEALAQDKFNNFIELIASQAVEGLTDTLVESFELQVA